jgi:hypothetical protein
LLWSLVFALVFELSWPLPSDQMLQTSAAAASVKTIQIKMFFFLKFTFANEQKNSEM